MIGADRAVGANISQQRGFDILWETEALTRFAFDLIHQIKGKMQLFPTLAGLGLSSI